MQKLGLPILIGFPFYWVTKIVRANLYSHRNINRLNWELEAVKKELDHFDELGGPEGMMEHQIYWEYQKHETEIADSLKKYEVWNTKSDWQKMISIPPNRLLYKY